MSARARVASVLQFVGLQHTQASRAYWDQLTPLQKTRRVLALILTGFLGVTLVNLKTKYGF